MSYRWRQLEQHDDAGVWYRNFNNNRTNSNNNVGFRCDYLFSLRALGAQWKI
jgi:nuclear transport factor 2 (NTF2) superfamily protein